MYCVMQEGLAGEGLAIPAPIGAATATLLTQVITGR